jgi:hypothetical protein
MENLKMPITKDNETKMRFVELSIRDLNTDLNTWFASLPMSIIAHYAIFTLSLDMSFDVLNDKLNSAHNKFRNESLEQKMRTFQYLNDVIKNGF